jgi:hypothetical protein
MLANSSYGARKRTRCGVLWRYDFSMPALRHFQVNMRRNICARCIPVVCPHILRHGLPHSEAPKPTLCAACLALLLLPEAAAPHVCSMRGCLHGIAGMSSACNLSLT